MAYWRGDGERLLGDAIRERELNRKVELLIEANLLLYRELAYVFTALGVENFSSLGLKELKEELKEED